MFYHPAIWWMSRVVRTERENCCDDVVVDMSGNAHEYAEALATLEQNRWSGREPAVAATGGSLVKRIRRLLYPQSPNGAWTPLFAAVILMAIAAVTLAGWQAAPAQQSADAAQKQSERAVTPYVKWLNEDVVYIIDDKERATFERLATDEERNKFIEQFWLRRVTPGSSDNKVKEEHYRRIAHANRYFRTASGGPGWQTDRGHMWIVYGPPDEIESHPSGETRTPYPFEDWKYYHVAGIGDNLFVKFVDRTRTGDFRVAPGNGH
jgi:GWxTD domain-containing protein